MSDSDIDSDNSTNTYISVQLSECDTNDNTFDYFNTLHRSYYSFDETCSFDDINDESFNESLDESLDETMSEMSDITSYSNSSVDTRYMRDISQIINTNELSDSNNYIINQIGDNDSSDDSSDESGDLFTHNVINLLGSLDTLNSSETNSEINSEINNEINDEFIYEQSDSNAMGDMNYLNNISQFFNYALNEQYNHARNVNCNNITNITNIMSDIDDSKEYSEVDDNLNSDLCPICMKSITINLKNIYFMKCAHKIHNNCYLELKNNNINFCPICRSCID